MSERPAPDPADATIAVVGPGRMGSAIAQVFAAAGHEVRLLDVKERTPAKREATFEEVHDTVASNLAFLTGAGRFDGDEATVRDRIECTADVSAALDGADWVFETLPEDPDVKTDFLRAAAEDVPAGAVITTATSSISLATLAPAAPDPDRLLITHWLNPAFIVPLVEVARSERTESTAVETTVELLDSVGKEPVICRDNPGFIGSRIQAAAMNEAVRAWEEGVASAAEIDTALQSGVGFRMAAMGLIEFIDIGGVDILYYVDEYLREELGSRFDPPESVVEKMENDDLGPSTGRGFYEYEDADTDDLVAEKYRVMLALRDALESVEK